jgi:hypothetical protein
MIINSDQYMNYILELLSEGLTNGGRCWNTLKKLMYKKQRTMAVMFPESE